MTDYGHDLLFSTFITPTAQPAHQAVELAVVADRAGLDLATFQDHPYLPRFHDTWTLISYAAARTERIRLSGNVLSLPLRQPAVLARSHASLDRLTGGRIELGLGAGAFWDGIEAIDDSAREAGRDPARVRRLLNINGTLRPYGRSFLDGPAEQWAEDLAGLTLEHGVSTFILAGDDPTVIEEFAPAVRELVAAERNPRP
jgi:luciferase-like monooxygenase